MIDFFLSDYTVNTLFHVAHQLNLINFTVVPKYLSSANAQYMRLSCSASEKCIGSLFPNTTFPPGSTAVMYFKTTQSPKVVFNVNQANWTANGYLRIEVSSSSPKNVLLLANVPNIVGLLTPKVYQNRYDFFTLSTIDYCSLYIINHWFCSYWKVVLQITFHLL